LSVENENYTE